MICFPDLIFHHFIPHIHLNGSVYGQAQLYMEPPAELTNSYFYLFAVRTNGQSGYLCVRYIQQSVYLPAHMHTLGKLADRCFFFFLLFSQSNRWSEIFVFECVLYVCLYASLPTNPRPTLYDNDLRFKKQNKTKTQRWWTHCSLKLGAMQPTWTNSSVNLKMKWPPTTRRIQRVGFGSIFRATVSQSITCVQSSL